jgi:hypothetical protein
MRLTLCILLAFAIAAVTGLSATWWTVVHGLPYGGLTIGPWRAEPDIGSLDANAYLRAGIAREGVAPLSYGDGLAFTALADDDGRPLQASCDYMLEGDLPAARLWTLAVFSPQGALLATRSDRHATSSAEATRALGAPLMVALSQEAQPGAWLPLAGSGGIALRLSLYDTALGTPLSRRVPDRLLSIRRGACR